MLSLPSTLTLPPEAGRLATSLFATTASAAMVMLAVALAQLVGLS